MMNFIKIIFSAVITFLIFFILCNSFIQKNLCKRIFIPGKNSSWKPESYEDVLIDYRNKSGKNTQTYFFGESNSFDGNEQNQKIHGWYIGNDVKNDTILFFHGTGESISTSKHIHHIAKLLDYNLFMIDYRGFGDSSTTKKGDIIRDSVLAYKWLKEKKNAENIIVWGESLGGAPAIEIASMFPCKFLILGSTFSSIADIGLYNEDSIISFFSHILSTFYELFPSKKKIGDVKCPVLLIHSQTDDVVPYRCSQELFNIIKNNHPDNKLITIAGSHTKPIFTLDNIQEIINFFRLEKNVNENLVLEILENRNDEHNA